MENANARHRCLRAHRAHRADPLARAGLVRPRAGARDTRRGIRLPPRLRPRRRPGRAADAVRPDRRAAVRARLDGFAAAAHGRQGGPGARGLPHRHARRRPGAGPLGLPPLDQLPLGRGPRHRVRGHRPRGAARRPGRDGRPGGARPLLRLAAGQRQGARRDRGDPPRPERGVGEGPHRRPQRRARGQHPAALDRCAPGRRDTGRRSRPTTWTRRFGCRSTSRRCEVAGASGGLPKAPRRVRRAPPAAGPARRAAPRPRQARPPRPAATTSPRPWPRSAAHPVPRPRAAPRSPAPGA